MKSVQVNLTYPQAMALRHELGWLNEDDTRTRRVLGRVLASLEDAIEKTSGKKFSCRFSKQNKWLV